MKNNVSIQNGRKGGRPNSDCYVSTYIIPNINMVILTEHQYNALLERYGMELLKKALSILEDWLKSSPIGIKYRGKNNYAHFRSDGWVINTAKMKL